MEKSPSTLYADCMFGESHNPLAARVFLLSRDQLKRASKELLKAWSESPGLKSSWMELRVAEVTATTHRAEESHGAAGMGGAAQRPPLRALLPGSAGSVESKIN